jgi:hypothetical protein
MAEQKRQIAVDAFGLQDFGSLDAFPGRGKLDQDAFALDAAILVGCNDLVRLGNRTFGIEGKVGIGVGCA